MARASLRGSLIAFEGCDKSGKTTQAAKLVGKLLDEGKQVMIVTFPDKTTPIGAIIDSYITSTRQLDDHAMHLLFSANMWEVEQEILSTLQKGTSVVIDRYAYSSIAFSAAKECLNLEWCKQPTTGLPKPDLVCFLDVTEEVAMQRTNLNGGWNTKPLVQEKMREIFTKLSDVSWVTVPSEGTFDEVGQKLYDLVKMELDKALKGELGKLWVEKQQE